jgi:hypothetical protein
MMELLLTAPSGVEINETIANGLTPLMVAAQRGHLKIVTMLLHAGAKLDVQDQYGRDALALAFQGGHAAVLTELKDWALRQPQLSNLLERQSRREQESALRKFAEDLTKKDLAPVASSGQLYAGAMQIAPTVDGVRAAMARGLRSSDAAKILVIASAAGRADIVDALLTGARAHLSSEDLTAAAAAAVGSGHGNVGRTLVEGGADAPWWWRRERLSDRATFLTFSDAEKHNSDLLVAAYERSGDTESFLVGSPREWHIRQAPLSFLPGHMLLAIENLDSVGQNEWFVIRRANGDLVPLDWTNEPIYQLVEQTPALLDRANVALYIRFFFHFVRGKLGDFKIVENIREIPWRKEATDELKERVSASLMPLKILRKSPNYVFAKAIMVFKNAMLNHPIRVATRKGAIFPKIGKGEENPRLVAGLGLLRLEDEKFLFEDLPIEVDGPRGVFG